MNLKMDDVLTADRPRRERKPKEPKKEREPKPKKQPRRWDASLRLYGPREAPTHARLIIGVEPPVDTPEAFYNELKEEDRVNAIAKDNGFWADPRIGFKHRNF